jgi:hypothetical protein
LIKLLDELVATKAAEAMRHPACGTERLQTVAIQQLRPVTRNEAPLAGQVAGKGRAYLRYAQPLVLGFGSQPVCIT